MSGLGARTFRSRGAVCGRASTRYAPRMGKTLLAVITVALLAAPAAAQEKNTGVGVGAEQFITGLSGAAVIYDAAAWRIDGILGFHDNGEQHIELGGRFLWVVHEGVGADFALGGGFGIHNYDQGGMNNDGTDIHIEALAQLRAFIVPNVALSAAVGLGIITGDGDGVEVSGQLLGSNSLLIGSVGIAYFFW